MQLSPADLFELKAGPVNQQLRLTGLLQAAERSTVRSKASGNITEVLALEGNVVNKGAVVIRIDATEARLRVQERQAALLAQEAQARQSKTQLDNNARLAQQGFVSETALSNAQASHDAALAQVNVARAQLDLARQALADTEVRAPFSGTVGPVAVLAGSKVSPDTALFDLLNLSAMELKAEVNAQDIPRLKTGQQAMIDPGNGQAPRQATLVRISPGSVQGGRSVPVYLSVANPDRLLRSGQFATATLELGSSRDGLLVPKTALRESQGAPMVYRLRDNQIEAQLVGVGQETTDPATGVALVEITKGLNAGDRIIGVNLGPLDPGTPVTVVAPSPATAP